MTGYFGNDQRPIEERLNALPILFLASPVIIIGETYRGEPKPEGMDNHAHVPERLDRPIVYVDCSFLANGASEGLKLSRHWQVAFIDCHFIGGVEEPVDIVRGGDLYFLHCDFESRDHADRDVTLKGGACRVTFEKCMNLRQLTLGDYTKYDAKSVGLDGKVVKAGIGRFARPGVRGVRLIDCGPLEVCLLHAAEPLALGDTQMRVKRGHLVAFYFWIRSTFFKEKNPVPEDEFKLDPREI